jgi:ATP-dependent Lon protease
MELKLTGLIGDVMQESMNIAKNIAWNYTSDERKSELSESMMRSKNQGIHIHCPEGGVKKDGPSGGCCITIGLFSLFNKLCIRNNIGITGEIDLHGNITAIGGLEFKIMGGIKSGVTHFFFPRENEDDLNDILDKYGAFDDENIKFTMISHVNDILKNKDIMSQVFFV